MWSLLVHPNNYKKNFCFFLFSMRNENAKPINKRKSKFNTDDLIFLKKSILPFGTLPYLSSYVDIEYNSAESLTNKYKLFETKSKRTINSLALWNKYIMIE